MGWAGHVARMGERRDIHRFCWRNLVERDHLGDPGLDGRIIWRGYSASGLGVHGLDWSGSG